MTRLETAVFPELSPGTVDDIVNRVPGLPVDKMEGHPTSVRLPVVSLFGFGDQPVNDICYI